MNKINNVFNIKNGDIVYVDFGKGYGSEQGGIRPAVIVQNDMGNKYAPTTIVVPMTSRMCKTKLPTHVEVALSKETGLSRDSIILAEQVRLVDKSRIKNKIGCLNNGMIGKLNIALMIALALLKDTTCQRNAMAIA